MEYAQPYQGTNYYLLEKVFDYLKEHKANKRIVDYGSGKGRVMVVAAHYRFTDITGIDFSSQLCEEARRNTDALNQFPSVKFTVIHAEATTYQIKKEDNVLFFFNPFDEVVMEQVVINIRQSLRKYPRKLYVAYINPEHKDLFEEAGFEEVFYIRKMEYVEASILTNTSS
jgi:ribosomal protein L11 methylase PrmA